MGYFDIFRVLRAGQEITNAETWKNRQALTAAIFTILSGAAGISVLLGVQIPVPTDPTTIQNASVFLGMVGFGLFNLWATYATTSRVGLPPRGSSVSGGVADGAGDGVAEGFNRDDPGADDPVPYLKDTQNIG